MRDRGVVVGEVDLLRRCWPRFLTTTTTATSSWVEAIVNTDEQNVPVDQQDVHVKTASVLTKDMVVSR